MPESIFGVQAPKFKSGETEVELDHIVIVRDEPDLDDTEHKSIITGYREWDKKGKHWIFEVEVYIYKYANPLTAYQNFKNYEFELVELWKRRDGNSFHNEDDEIVYFFIESMEELYLEHYQYPDVLRVRFLSQNPIDIPIGGTPPIPLWSPEALVYFNQLDPLPPFDVQEALAEFIDGLVSDEVYDDIIEMWMLAMNNEANSMRGMKNFRHCTAHGSPTHTAYRGWQGVINENRFLNTNFVPSTDGFSLDSSSFGIYSRTNANLSNRVDMGSQSATAGQQALLILNYINLTTKRIALNNSLSGSVNIGSSTLGSFFGSRTSSSNIRYFFNGTFGNHNAISINMSPQEIYIGANNNNGTPSSTTGRQYAFAFVGKGLSDAQLTALNNRLLTFLTYIGANV